METNPWVSAEEVSVEEEAPAPTPEPESFLRGVSSPQGGVPAPAEELRLPFNSLPDGAHASGIWCVGVTGGAGESTVAALDNHWHGAGHAWPVLKHNTPRVLLICRSDARGLRAAQGAAQQWAAGLVGAVELLGLVVVADAPGRLPKSLREQLEVVSGGVPRTWQLPWSDELRLGADPAPERFPRSKGVRLVNEVATLVGGQT